MSVTREHRLKRLKIRSWRRGTKEMDLILGRFWDREGESLAEAELEAYEALLGENDQDLYQWLSGQANAPEMHQEIIARIHPA